MMGALAGDVAAERECASAKTCTGTDLRAWTAAGGPRKIRRMRPLKRRNMV